MSLNFDSLVYNNVSTKNGESSGMNTTNIVQSNLTRKVSYSNYSINFDGINDYLDLNNASGNIMTNKNAISISGWFKLDSNTTSAVFGNWYGSTSVQYLLRYNTSTGLGIQWYIYSNSNTTRLDTNYFPSVGDWVHVVGVKDPITNGGQSRVYINSVEYTLDSTNLSVAIANNSGSDQIGVFNNSSNPINGSISNVAYWTDTALTQDDVINLYNNGITQDLNNFRVTPTVWCPLDQSYTYFNGSVLVARDVISGNDATGIDIVQENIVGNAPGSEANGTGGNLSIANLKSDMLNSTSNSYSINMADYADGVTNPANSGRSTDTPS